MSAPHEDYYAILQIAPDAEPEVIEAAYRQLMRKYHPDMAGTDRERAAVLHERAKSINRAYAVLHDPRQRWIYDRLPGRRAAGAAWPPPSSSWPADGGPAAATGSPRPTPPSASGADARTWPAGARPGRARHTPRQGPWSPVLATLSNLYYLLPGPYEWEGERDKDLLATLLLPPLGLAGWSLATGRLALLTGHAPFVGWFAWALIAVLALPLWSALPRLLLAGAPTALLLTGMADGLLRLAGIPLGLVWGAASVFGIVVSARLYLFGVVPTLVMCSLVANAGPVAGALVAVMGTVGGSVSTAQLGVLTIASLIGVLTWLTVISWDHPSAAVAASTRTAAQPGPQAQAPAGAVDPNQPLFRRISADRVQAMQTVPLRTDRDRREAPSAVVAAQQEANVLLVRDPWAFVQTDDGREGWAEWSVAS